MKDDLRKKILILDGATGTAIQEYRLDKKSYIHEDRELTGCHEILNLNREDIIIDIHRRYIQAGADIIETNTFNANPISLRDYGIEGESYHLAYEGARLARKAADESERKVWVVGSIGPTSKSASIPTKKDPLTREVEFDELLDAYRVQAEGLLEGGVDLFLIETIFDGLNAKAAVIACEEASAKDGRAIPIMISATVDREGRLLSGQDMYSLVRALDRDSIISYGLNCSFGAKDLIPLVERLGKCTDKYLSIYPNAGLPNAEGEYDEDPETMLSYLKPLIDNEKINIVGGCCGTTPSHIRTISEYAIDKDPRQPQAVKKPFLSGNSVLEGDLDFYMVGERNNVAGSRKFKRLIEEKKYEEALEISRSQVERGANIIDVNLDDALLDSEEVMVSFLRILGNDTFTSKIPIMIDSSDFQVIERALKVIPGRAIVNSISLKEGKDEFLRKARIIRKYGAALVVMAFDEEGQAVTSQRKIDICKRAYDLLIQEGWSGEDIVFDTNILTIGTGREEDRHHALSFIDSLRWIDENLPGARVSGGVSNLSFAFRGNDYLRRIIHHLFLEKAREAGLAMAILNPGEEVEHIPEDLRRIVEDLLDGKDVLNDILSYSFEDKKPEKKNSPKPATVSVEDRVKDAIIRGGSSTFDSDIHEALKSYSPLNLIQSVLMDAMTVVGEKFEGGELYLPQIIRSASAMERAVNILTPLMESESTPINTKGRILMCTVSGDVHDIGKNITGTVLRCNGYDVIDLGVMVDRERIYKEAVENNVDIVSLSGLISPSLREMEEVVLYFDSHSSAIPILIGGAATSRLHTSLKLEPKYRRRVIHVTDASSTLPVVAGILGEASEEFIGDTMKQYELMRTAYETTKKKKSTQDISTARGNRNQLAYTPSEPKIKGLNYLEIPLKELEPLMDWDIFLGALRVKGTSHEKKSLTEGRELFKSWIEEGIVSKAAYGVYPATREEDTVLLGGVRIPLVRNQGETTESLADYIEEEDYMGAFVASVEAGYKDNIIHQLLANTLAEATSEYLQGYISKTNWSIGLRPAIGYPSLPDHTLKADIFQLVDGERTGAKLSPNFAMSPGSTVCGLYIGNPEACYINPRTVLEDQIEEMAWNRGVSPETLKKYLAVLS